LPHPESRMTRTRIRVDSSPSVRFPTWNLMTGIYLEIGPWKFNTIFGPTRQTVKARSMPNTVGSHLSRRSSAKTEPPGRSPIIQVPPATATAHHHQSAAPRPHALFVPEGDRAQCEELQPWTPSPPPAHAGQSRNFPSRRNPALSVRSQWHQNSISTWKSHQNRPISIW